MEDKKREIANETRSSYFLVVAKERQNTKAAGRSIALKTSVSWHAARVHALPGCDEDRATEWQMVPEARRPREREHRREREGEREERWHLSLPPAVRRYRSPVVVSIIPLATARSVNSFNTNRSSL